MAEVSITTPGDPINDPSQKVVRTRSRFPGMSYPNFNTHRFGVYHPFFVMEGVEGDKINLRSSHDIRSFTLKAPLMQDIFRNKDFYSVPMEAILPVNWEKFYINPTLGDDVSDNVGCGVASFWNKVGAVCTNLLSQLRNDLAGSGSDALKFTEIFRFLIFCEYFYSAGSLIECLGCHSHNYMRLQPLTGSSALYPLVRGGIDELIDYVCTYLTQNYASMTVDIDGDTKFVILQNNPSNYGAGYTSPLLTLHDFLEYLRDDLNCSISSVTASASTPFAPIADAFDASKVTITFSDVEQDYNLSRLFAYQLCCAHFYSNDHVDFIYSADLYRSLIGYYVSTLFNVTNMQFTYNGVKYYYDWCSAKMFDLMINITASYLFNTSTGSAQVRGYYSAIFAHRRSLRFVDYFTGSRTRPLAVGNVDANVVSNKVNIVDVTQNIQKQRFLNAVNRFGRKFREYINGLSGVTPAVDYHNPLYLGHTRDSIFGVETDNTGADQLLKANTITSRLQSNGARYQFEVDVDRSCVIIGISYYDIERVYITTTDRQLLHMNRFDMFNPFMQFIGDQGLSIAEIGTKRFFTGAPYDFGYQLRHMEYKQRFPVAAGGFVKNLPGFIFDNSNDDDRTPSVPVQSTDFIRSLPSELDRFYVSLTGWSLGTYFHFIVKDYNDCDPSRPMAYAPTIL